MNKDYLTTKEYADLTGIKYKTVCYWYKKGRFDADMQNGIIQIKNTKDNLEVAKTFGQNLLKHNSGRKKYSGKDVICDWCKKVFYKPLSKVFERNFCEPEHQRAYFREHLNEFMGGKYKLFGEDNPTYKGVFCKYDTLHSWVEFYRGKALVCVECGVRKEDGVIIEWSNDSGMYIRDLTDFSERCQKCHKAYDKANGFTRKNWFDEAGNRIAYPTEEQIKNYYNQIGKY